MQSKTLFQKQQKGKKKWKRRSDAKKQNQVLLKHCKVKNGGCRMGKEKQQASKVTTEKYLKRRYRSDNIYTRRFLEKEEKMKH